jgi:hypothetical protein
MFASIEVKVGDRSEWPAPWSGMFAQMETSFSKVVICRSVSLAAVLAERLNSSCHNTGMTLESVDLHEANT